MAEAYLKIPRTRMPEGTAFQATAYFRSGDASSAPSTLKYRLDCLTTRKVVTDWTTLTAAAAVNFNITATQNATQDQSRRTELKQITVSANHGLATQFRATAKYRVENIEGF